MTTVIAMCSEDRGHTRKCLAEHLCCMCLLGLRRFPVLVPHWNWRVQLSERGGVAPATGNATPQQGKGL